MRYSARQTRKLTSTARSGGAVGPNARVPKVVRQLAASGDRILDYGAGPDEIHAKRFRRAGFDVSTYEIGDNRGPSHDPNALNRSHDIVYASNVLNVQPSAEHVRGVLDELKRASKKGGVVVANYPSDPRRPGVQPATVERWMRDRCSTVTNVGSQSAPVWIAEMNGRRNNPKRTKSATYVHRSALGALTPSQQRAVQRAVRSAGNVAWNVVKVRHDGRVSLLHYPDFDSRTNPRLSRSTVVTPAGDVREWTYVGDRRPVLHRKALLMQGRRSNPVPAITRKKVTAYVATPLLGATMGVGYAMAKRKQPVKFGAIGAAAGAVLGAVIGVVVTQFGQLNVEQRILHELDRMAKPWLIVGEESGMSRVLFDGRCYLIEGEADEAGEWLDSQPNLRAALRQIGDVPCELKTIVSPGCRAHEIPDLSREQLGIMADILHALRRLSEYGNFRVRRIASLFRPPECNARRDGAELGRHLYGLHDPRADEAGKPYGAVDGDLDPAGIRWVEQHTSEIPDLVRQLTGWRKGVGAQQYRHGRLHLDLRDRDWTRNLRGHAMVWIPEPGWVGDDGEGEY